MPPAEEVVVRKPEDKRGVWHSLLANNQYNQIAASLEKAHKKAVDHDNMEKAALLAAASQLCASCMQLQQEVSFHEQAYHQSESRRDQMDAELKKLLEMVEVVPETAVLSLSDVSHDLPEPSLKSALVLETKPTIWQRVKALLRGKKTSVAETAALPPKLTKLQQSEISSALSDTLQAKTPASNRPNLFVYCLGVFSVYEDEMLVEEWPSRKGKAIFKYLLIHRKQKTNKEVLMDLFWPDAVADAARNNLNVAIYGLRQALRKNHVEFSHVLFQDDSYWLNPELQIWTDFEAFLQLVQAAQQFEKNDQLEIAISKYHAAEALYRGEFLMEDRYEEWLIPQRRLLKNSYLKLLDRLSKYYFQKREYVACVTICRQLLVVEPCRESTHRLLMICYCQQNQRYLGLRQYHQCEEALLKELETIPSSETTQLYEKIRDHKPI